MMINRHKHIFGIAHNIYVSRLVSFIRALRDEAIRKMSFEYARLREAGKHFLGGLGVCYSIGIRSNIGRIIPSTKGIRSSNRRSSILPS